MKFLAWYLAFSLIASALLVLFLMLRARVRYGVFGHGATLLDSLRQDSSLRPLTRLQAVKWWIHDNAGRLVCLVKGGCNFDTHSFHSNRLYFCTRCARELTGRTFADLVPEPMGADDYWEDER
jgi:hypothetical protein